MNLACKLLLEESRHKVSNSLVTKLDELKPKDPVSVRLTLRDNLSAAEHEHFISEIKNQRNWTLGGETSGPALYVIARMKSLLRALKRQEILLAELAEREKSLPSDSAPVTKTSLVEIRELKQELRERLSQIPGVLKVGIARDDGTGWLLRVEVQDDASANLVPTTFNGAAVRVVIEDENLTDLPDYAK